MPILSAYFGSSQISYLIYKSSHDYFFNTYPYVYSKNLFGQNFTEKSFYRQVLDYTCAQANVSLKDCELLIAADQAVHDFGDIPVRLTMSTVEALALESEYMSFIVDALSITRVDGFFTSGSTDVNYLTILANSKIYPSAVTKDAADLTISDNALRMIKTPSLTGGKILMSGSRFNAILGHKTSTTYLLALDILNGLGAYTVYIDDKNSLISLLLLKKYDIAAYNSLNSFGYKPLCTLLNSGGAVECLLEVDGASKQLIDVDSEKLFFEPLEEGSQGRLVSKNFILGTLEKTIVGGILGLVIDTRSVSSYSEKEQHALLKSIDEVAKGL